MSEKDLLQVVSFTLGDEFFGAPITKIQEIIRYTNVVKIPRSPEFIEGIINLRGRVIPVIDMKTRFNMVKAGEKNSTSSRIIVAEIGKARVGLTVDSVAKVIRADWANLEKAPSIVSEVDQQFITGVLKTGNEMLLILDLDRIFTQEETELLASV